MAIRETDTRYFGGPPTGFFQALRSIGLEELNRVLFEMGTPPGRYSTYSNKLIAICLLQGTAQHLVDIGGVEYFDNKVIVETNKIAEKGLQVLQGCRVICGIKDIDLCLFFEPGNPPMPRTLKSKIKQFPKLGYRKVDLIKVNVPEYVLVNVHRKQPEIIIRGYMDYAPRGIKYWRNKSVIGLYPNEIYGKFIWTSERWCNQIH